MHPVFSVDAFKAFSAAHDATAHNLANINTDEFRSMRLDLETGPEGKGVKPSLVTEDRNPGPVVHRQELVEDEQKVVRQREVAVHASNTDVAREIAQMIRHERAFEASARVVRTYDHLAGNIIDVLV